MLQSPRVAACQTILKVQRVASRSSLDRLREPVPPESERIDLEKNRILKQFLSHKLVLKAILLQDRSE